MSGDVVRIQPNHLSFSSLAAVDDIHGLRTPAGKASQYTQIMRIRPKVGPENIFNTVYSSLLLSVFVGISSTSSGGINW